MQVPKPRSGVSSVNPELTVTTQRHSECRIQKSTQKRKKAAFGLS